MQLLKHRDPPVVAVAPRPAQVLQERVAGEQ